MKNNSSSHSVKEKGASFFSKVHDKLSQSSLYTLVAMQLRNRIDLNFKRDLKGALTKLIIGILLLVGVTALITVVFTVLKLLRVFGDGLPVSLFNIFFFFILFLNIISCLGRLTNSLYFSADNQVLLSYPVKGSTIFLSKLIVFFVLELVKNFTFLVPLFLAYGISHNISGAFYPWMILCFFILALLPVAIGSLLSIPYLYIKLFFKKHQNTETIIVLAILIAITVGIFYAVNLIPDNLDIANHWQTDYLPAITNFTRQIETYLAPLVFLSGLIFGYKAGGINDARNLPIFTNQTWLILLVIIAIYLALFAIAYFVVQPLFYKMSSKPFEYSKQYINHNYKIPTSKLGQLYKTAFVPVLEDKKLTKVEKNQLISEFKKYLRILNKEEKLFIRGKVDERRISRFLKKYIPNYKFVKVGINEYLESEKLGYVIDYNYDIPSLTLVYDKGVVHFRAYDPNHLSSKNYSKNKVVSQLFKDVLIDLRTPGAVVNYFLLFIVTPLAVLILNKFYAAMSVSKFGGDLTIFFNVLIIGMILLASNVTMASVYSREGKTSYLLRASPSNYLGALTLKLILRAIITTSSLIFAVVIYSEHCPIDYLNPTLLFFGIWFVYIAHLIWSAELDFMKPMDRLYAEVGEGAVSNPNETLSGILSIVISLAFAALTYFFVKENAFNGFIKIFLIALAFLIARVVLFILKIIGYGTSRSEDRREE